MEKLPIEAAIDVGKKYNLDRVLLIGVSHEPCLTHTVSWGKTKEDCGHAAMDIQKLRAVIDAQPTSLYEAKEVAKRIHPRNVEGIENKCAYDEEGRTTCLEIVKLEITIDKQRKLMAGLIQLISDLDANIDPGWDSITTPDIVVESIAIIAGIKKI